MKINFACSKNQSQPFMHIQIVLSMTTVTLNKRINYMNIGFVVVGLLVIDDGN